MSILYSRGGSIFESNGATSGKSAATQIVAALKKVSPARLALFAGSALRDLSLLLRLLG
jgi:hypothetical protein